MTNLTVRTPEVPTKSIPQDTVAALRSKVRGVVALPGEDGYDAARTIGLPGRLHWSRPSVVSSANGAPFLAHAVAQSATSCGIL